MRKKVKVKAGVRRALCVNSAGQHSDVIKICDKQSTLWIVQMLYIKYLKTTG